MRDEPERLEPRRAVPGDDAVDHFTAPLTVIKGNCQLLRRWLNRGAFGDTGAAHARLDGIETMVDRLVAAIHDSQTTNDVPASPGRRGPLPSPPDDRH